MPLPIRIAFTSCMTAHNFDDQPVWDEIAALHPDVLVLLGDSIYLDCGGPYSMGDVQKLTAYPFAQHAHSRYVELLDQPQFKALVTRASLRTYAIWDDHDFLWDNACGADVARSPVLNDMVTPSRALFAAYRQALALRLAPGSFPAVPPFFDATSPSAPGYTKVQLGDQLFLHLTDGRSFKKGRGKKALLGQTQCDAIEAALADSPPGAIHLLASGVVFEATGGENWLACATEHQWLLNMASQYNILVLSGDIHDVNWASYPAGPARYLHEGTASGAAVKTGVTVGKLRRNFGLLNIGANTVQVDIYQSGQVAYQRSIDRVTWQLA